MAQALPQNPHGAPVGVVESGDAGQKRGFPAAGRSDQGNKLARRDREGDSAKGKHLLITGVEEAVQVSGLECR